MDEAIAVSTLPEDIDVEFVNDLLINIRKEQFKNLIELAVRNVMDTEKKFKEKDKDEEKGKEELVKSYRYELNTLNYVFDTHIADEYKWRICYPYTWIEEIANYLFIYKTFDCENNVIFVYGG